jgi:hypothetical protein
MKPAMARSLEFVKSPWSTTSPLLLRGGLLCEAWEQDAGASALAVHQGSERTFGEHVAVEERVTDHHQLHVALEGYFAAE